MFRPLRQYSIFALLAIGLLCVPLGLAQKTEIQVDGKIIKGYIAVMSAPEHEGRKSLTPGYRKAAEWAAAKFKEWGLQPAGGDGTFFQSVPIKGNRGTFAWTEGTPELEVDGRKFYIKDNDFQVDPASTAKTKVKGDVVFVGYGISAPSKGLDEYTMDVKGKIVLALKGSPMDAPAARSMFGPRKAAPAGEETEDVWAEEAKDLAKAQTAYDKGAAALILYNPTPAAASPFGPRMRRVMEQSPFKRDFIFISNIDASVFRWIMARNPQETARGFGARVGEMQRDIKDKKVRSMRTGVKAQIRGYDSVTLYGEKFNNNVARNVVAKIEGTDPVLKNQYVIMGGHLDHLGMTNGVVYNGADDNASGSAVTMEVARLLAAQGVQPKRTIIFALWCGEELGLLGSRHYAESPSDGVTMDGVVTYFNMDMVGLGTEIGAPGALNFPKIYEVIKRDQDPDVIKAVKPSTGGPGGSDHSAFIERGIEALALMTRGGVGHPDYHDAGDDVGKIDPVILEKTGQFVLQATLNLANETETDLLIPDRQHLYNGMRLNIPNITSGGGGWQFIQASSNADLAKLADNRIKQLKNPQSAGPMARMRRRGPSGPRVNLGIRDAGYFEGSVPLLTTLANLLDFRRVDVVKDDGVWFDGGLTKNGHAALQAMEANNLVFNFIDPSSGLLGDALAAAKKPFLVTVSSATSWDVSMYQRMREQGVILAVDCKPDDLRGCVNRLESAKEELGGSDRILLSMNASGDITAKKKELYLTLVKIGWTKDEIYGMVGLNPNGRPGGNLAIFSPGQ